MSNGLPKYDFLYDNNTFPVSSISGLRDFNKNTMDPSSRTRASSLQSFIKVYSLWDKKKKKKKRKATTKIGTQIMAQTKVIIKFRELSKGVE